MNGREKRRDRTRHFANMRNKLFLPAHVLRYTLQRAIDVHWMAAAGVHVSALDRPRVLVSVVVLAGHHARAGRRYRECCIPGPG